MTRRSAARILLPVALLCLCVAAPAAAQPPPADLLQFFAEEAEALRLVTAARHPHSAREAPATVHVVDRQDLAAYGPFHLPDALRGIPGVDVFSARTAHGLVGIRGLSKVNNNRTLVLLDGRRTLDSSTESLNWEALPVSLADIERIEIVEGPASAVYGGNAITGVINIITRSAADVDGVEVTAMAGDRDTRQAGVLFGRTGLAGVDVRASGEVRSLGRFEDDSETASEVMRGSAQLRYPMGDGREAALAGGYVDSRTDVSLGGLGHSDADGRRGFVRGDYVHGPHRLRASWMGGSSQLASFASDSGSRLRFRTFEAQAVTQVPVSATARLLVGAEVRGDGTSSGLADASHEVWALFFEHRWRARPGLSLWLSSRVDRHPHTGAEVSPRVTAVAEPARDHTLRLSVGTAFRHPTLVENHIQLRSALDIRDLDPTGGLDTLELVVLGNTRLRPERLRFAEAAHEARFGRLRARGAVFYYRLDDVYAVTEPVAAVPRPRVATAEATFDNGGTTEAAGAEAEIRAPLFRDLSFTGSYSYQSLSGRLDDQVAGRGTPHHKGSVRLRYLRGSLRIDAAVHAVGASLWNRNSLAQASSYGRVDGYRLVNLSLRYRLPTSSALHGFEVQLLAYNLLDDTHLQVLPMETMLVGGQGGEQLRSRRAMRLVYGF